MRIGKYIVYSEWIYTGDFVSSKEIEYSDPEEGSYYLYIDVTIPQSGFIHEVRLPPNHFNKEHIAMYGCRGDGLHFSSLFEAQDHVDDFLTKLSRLKSFL